MCDAINEFVNDLVAVPLDHTSVKVHAPVDQPKVPFKYAGKH